MRTLCVTLLLIAAIVPQCFAQRLEAGMRGGANATDFPLRRVPLGDGVVAGGNTQAGFECALMVRFNIVKHLYMQSEFEFALQNYQLRYITPIYERNIRVQANRIELPLILGLKFGSVTLFGGTYVRIAHSEKSSAPKVVSIDFNDSDIGVMGGVGLSVGQFFVEARVTGYPTPFVVTTVESNGISERVRVGRNIRYSLSVGVFFGD